MMSWVTLHDHPDIPCASSRKPTASMMATPLTATSTHGTGEDCGLFAPGKLLIDEQLGSLVREEVAATGGTPASTAP